jgi:hypothetical protein
LPLSLLAPLVAVLIVLAHPLLRSLLKDNEHDECKGYIEKLRAKGQRAEAASDEKRAKRSVRRQAVRR